MNGRQTPSSAQIASLALGPPVSLARLLDGVDFTAAHSTLKLVHGAGTAQLALAAGVLDELEIHLIPVLFGQGRRLFDNLRPEHIELERTRILEGEAGVTHVHYRVQR